MTTQLNSQRTFQHYCRMVTWWEEWFTRAVSVYCYCYCYCCYCSAVGIAVLFVLRRKLLANGHCISCRSSSSSNSSSSSAAVWTGAPTHAYLLFLIVHTKLHTHQLRPRDSDDDTTKFSKDVPTLSLHGDVVRRMIHASCHCCLLLVKQLVVAVRIT